MDSSPKGRQIEYVVGNADAIVTRGNQITTLGDQMISSAETLNKIADGATGQKGLAVNKLKDVVGECYKDLKLAGERYKPTGPALVQYGQTLADVQPKIKSAVDDCDSDWNVYQQKAGAVIPVAVPSGTSPSDDGKAKAKAEKDHKETQDAADGAYNSWKGRAEDFDSYYDTWEAAFDKAVHDIGKADSGGIEDSFWDDLDGFVAAALEVLKWVGLALAIAAIVIGGPIIMAAAAIVAIATLALTVYSFARGNSNGWDLAFAIIGVIPFGSAGKLLSGGKMEFLHDMFGGVTSMAGRAKIAANFSDYANAGHGLVAGFSRAGGGIAGLTRGLRGGYMALAGPNGAGVGNTICRLFTGQNMADISKAGQSPLSILAGTWGDGFVKNIFGIPDAIGDLHNKLGLPGTESAQAG
jgi:hypothetical protein